MTPTLHAATIAALDDALARRENWCGETHLQKVTYFLQEMLDVPLGLAYILYKHGPFSFELRDRLATMKADGILEAVRQPIPYGPRLLLTEFGHQLIDDNDAQLCPIRPRLEFVAERLAPMGVTELERVATAHWVLKKVAPQAPPEERARQLVELKPHIQLAQAIDATGQVDAMRVQAAPVL
jgi:hypothetical protein